jgi:two-component system sensor histidine kinase KdpD
VQLRTVAYVWGIDAALSPIGQLAAFASTTWRFAFLAVLPLAGLLVILSQERVRRMAAELESTRAREALIAGASHELQTPLAVLSGLVDTLVRTPHLAEERRMESYASMQRQAGHLRHLVAQFVDYARLKAGQDLLISPRPTPVAPVLEAVAELWRASAVVHVNAADAGSAVVDPASLHGVALALVSNAIKHGPPEGPVDVEAFQRSGRVVIEVADRGPGIAEDRLEEVFEELHPATDRREGSGLGLFLSRTALRAQGGDVRLRPREGGGLVATVFLPARRR